MKPCGSPCTGGLLFTAVLLCLACLSGGCIQGMMPVCHPNYFHDMEKEALGEEIIRLETILVERPGNLKKSASYFSLALLYAHHDNPAPDYARSLTMFENYLRLNPDSWKKEEIRYYRNLIQGLIAGDRERTLLRNENGRMVQNNNQLRKQNGQLVEDNGKLTKQNEILAAKNEKLVRQNQQLAEAMEQLKLLDVSLEQRRSRH